MKRSLMIVAVVAALGAAFLAGCYVVATPGGLGVGIDVPRMTYIAGTPIQSVSGVSGDVFYYDNLYWRWYNGRWWRSTVWNRGWVVVGTVPRVFLAIPRTHPAHHVVHHHPHYKKPAKVKTSPPGANRPVVRTPVVKTPVVKRPVVKRPVAGGLIRSAVEERKKGKGRPVRKATKKKGDK